VRNRITQVRSIDSAEKLDLRVWAAELRDHPAGRQVDIQAEARVGDETVWRGTSTYLHRTPRPEARAPRPVIAPPPPAVAYWRLPGDLGRRYAAVSGDRNPIHLSRLTAKAFGFPRAIAHGMWLNARVLGAMESRLPAAYTIDVAFKTPTFLPSAVAFDADRTDDGWTLGVRNARSGKPHLSATISSQR
jgi:acyl dehydratase